MAVAHGSDQRAKAIFHAVIRLRLRFNGPLLFDLVAQEADIVFSQFLLPGRHFAHSMGTPIGRSCEADGKPEVHFRSRRNTAGRQPIAAARSGLNQSFSVFFNKPATNRI
jgi:hypothetical protein